jgi:hypothetical protein
MSKLIDILFGLACAAAAMYMVGIILWHTYNKLFP